MLADPLVLYSAIDRTAAQLHAGTDSTISLVCTGRSPTSSTYRYEFSSSHFIEVFVGHQYGKRNRYTVRVTESELVTDPIDSSKNSVRTESAYFVVDRSLLGASTSSVSLQTMLGVFLLKPSDVANAAAAVLQGQT
jgi:hypothetical protein